jgi:hypothetical protein
LEYYAQLIHQREPAVDDVIGFMDGVSLTSECTSEPVVQSSMYSGYHSDTMVNNLFAYGPDGRVIFCAINYPRSCLPRSGDALDVLVGPISHAQAYQLAPNLCPYLIRLSNIYVSFQQASEWGMRGLQGTFP